MRRTELINRMQRIRRRPVSLASERDVTRCRATRCIVAKSVRLEGAGWAALVGGASDVTFSYLMSILFFLFSAEQQVTVQHSYFMVCLNSMLPPAPVPSDEPSDDYSSSEYRK